MKKLFIFGFIIFGFIIFLPSVLFAQATSTDAVRQTINTMMDAMRKGDSALLRSVLARDLEVKSVADDKMGEIRVSTKTADDLVTQIGTPHPDPYDERIAFGDIKIDGPVASVWTSYKFYVGAKFSHCGVNYFQLIRTEGVWKVAHIVFTTRQDNCKQ
jgi:hypothetical protein